MKKHIDILKTPTPGDGILSRHVQVLIDYQSVNFVHRLERQKNWDRWQLIYTVDGKGLLTWSGGQLSLLPQMAVLMSANTEYAFSADPGVKKWSQYSMVFLPRAHWYDWLRWPEISPGIMSLRVHDEVRERVELSLKTACDIAANPRPHWEDFTMAAAELVLLEFRELNTQPEKQQHANPRLQRAVEFMERNHSKSITREEIARAANVSPSYLNALFQKHLATTPLHYLDMLRINKAQRLLRETNEPISRIGYLCGFDSATYFCRRFKKITGHSPGAYRKTLK